MVLGQAWIWKGPEMHEFGAIRKLSGTWVTPRVVPVRAENLCFLLGILYPRLGLTTHLSVQDILELFFLPANCSNHLWGQLQVPGSHRPPDGEKRHREMQKPHDARGRHHRCSTLGDTRTQDSREQQKEENDTDIMSGIIGGRGGGMHPFHHSRDKFKSFKFSLL